MLLKTHPDQILGTAAAVAGSTGATIQWVTDFSNIALIAINLVVAVAGGVLVYNRIRLTQAERGYVRRKMEILDE